MENRLTYDFAHKGYQPLYRDNACVVHLPYLEFLASITGLGELSDLDTMYAISSVIGRSLQSYFPPINFTVMSDYPLCNRICGRGVNGGIEGPVIMWSMIGDIPRNPHQYKPDHFVLLSQRSKPVEEFGGIISDDESYIVSTSNESLLASPLIQVTAGDSTEVSDLSLLEQTGIEQEFTTLSQAEAADSSDKESLGNFECNVVTHQKILEETVQDDSEETVLPSGMTSLPRYIRAQEKWLQLEQICKLLANNKATHLDSIPNGLKENVYCVFKKSKDRKRNDFTDDCGAWCSFSRSSLEYMNKPDGSLGRVYVKDRLVCEEKRRSGKRVYQPITPQPDSSAIITVYMYYTKLKADKTYERRITWIERRNGLDSDEKCVAEYRGVFPGFKPHGNCTTNTEAQYVRLNKTVREQMTERLQHDTQMQTYTDLRNQYGILHGPRNDQQARNM